MIMIFKEKLLKYSKIYNELMHIPSTINGAASDSVNRISVLQFGQVIVGSVILLSLHEKL